MTDEEVGFKSPSPSHGKVLTDADVGFKPVSPAPGTQPGGASDADVGFSSRQPATDQAMSDAASKFNPTRTTTFGTGVPASMRMLQLAGKAAISSIKPIARGLGAGSGLRIGWRPGENWVTPIDPKETVAGVMARQNKIYQENPFLAATQRAPEFANKVFPTPPDAEKEWYGQLGTAVGSFAPVLASGALAPLTIGLETLGDITQQTYAEKIKQGIDPERAARETFDKALAGGATATVVWSVLPKPLKSVFDKYLIDKLGWVGAKRFFLDRAAQAAEGGALGVTSTAAENIATGEPWNRGLLEGGAGVGIAQAFFPRGATAREHRIYEDLQTLKRKALEAYNKGVETSRRPVPDEETRFVTTTPEGKVAGEKVPTVGEPIEQLRQEAEDAIKEGKESKGGEPERERVSQRKDVPGDVEKVRTDDSKQAGGGGGAGAKTPVEIEAARRELSDLEDEALVAQKQDVDFPVEKDNRIKELRDLIAGAEKPVEKPARRKVPEDPDAPKLRVVKISEGRWDVVDGNGNLHAALANKRDAVSAAEELDPHRAARAFYRDNDLGELERKMGEAQSEFDKVKDLPENDHRRQLAWHRLKSITSVFNEHAFPVKDTSAQAAIGEKREKVMGGEEGEADIPPEPKPLPLKELPRKESPPQTELNKSLRELLSPEELQEYRQLVRQWADLDIEGGKLINKPYDSRVWDIVEKQRLIQMRLHAIQSKLPDGDIYDIVGIGSGAGNVAVAVHGGVERQKTLILEHSGGKGVASGKTPRYANVMGADSPLGKSGKRKVLMDRWNALRQGTEFRNITEVESMDYDPVKKIWTIKTKGLGAKGEGAETFRTRWLSIGVGTRPRKAPFPVVDDEGNKLKVMGDIAKIHLDDANGMRTESREGKKPGEMGGDMAALGGANSTGQGAVEVASEPNTGPVHIIHRHPKLDMSGYLDEAVANLIEKGKIILHLNQKIDHVITPKEKGGDYIVVMKDLGTGKESRLAVKSVGSFIGGVPNTEFLPKEWLRDKKGFIRTTEDLHPIRYKKGGRFGVKTEPVPGVFAVGTVRSAEGINRIASSEGEGARMVALTLTPGRQAQKAGTLPAWKPELEAHRRAIEDLAKAHPISEAEMIAQMESEVGGTTSFWKPSKVTVGTEATLGKGKKSVKTYVSEAGHPALLGGPVGTPTKIIPPKLSPPLIQQPDQQQSTDLPTPKGRPRPGEPVEATEARAQARAQAQPAESPGMIAEPRVRERLVNAPQTLPTETLRDSITDARNHLEDFHPRTDPERALVKQVSDRIEGWKGIVEARETELRNDPVKAEAEATRRVAANVHYPDKLVTDLSTGKKFSLDAADEVVMLKDRDKLQNQRDDAARIAMDEGKTKEERSEAGANFEDLDAQIRLRDRVSNQGNVFNGSKARQLWHQFRKRDYELPTMEQKLRVAKGGEALTKPEIADLKKKVDALDRAMVDTQKAKARTGWRPGLGEKVAPGVRHKQYVEHQAKEALDNTVFKETAKHRSMLAKGIGFYRNVAGVSRAIQTADMTSALLRQGGLLFRGNPWRSLRLARDTIRAAKSDEGYFKLMQDIRERPNAEMYVRSKLALTDIKSPKMQDLEEAYMGQWTDKIPILNHSQRAYVYFLNRLRADTFDTMAANLGRNGNVTLEQAKGLSNFINVFTGRGHIPEQAAGAVSYLNELFFAPRYVISRFQALTLQPLRYTNAPGVRKLIAIEYAKTLIGYAVFYGLVGTALKQLGATVEYNPLSSDFGKIKIGNTRWDPLSGLAQVTTFTARALTGYTKTSEGKIEPLFGSRAFTSRKYGDVLWKFAWSKFAPVPAAFVNTMGQEKVTGEKTTGLAEARGLVTPLNLEDVRKALMQQGVTLGVASFLISNFGDSINTYATKVKVRQRKQHRSRSR